MIGFLVLVMGAAVKAHIHFIRLALLAAMGLAGMYMMHKLAQDWQKISHRPMKPAAMAGKLLGLWKRSIPDEVSAFMNIQKNHTYVEKPILEFFQIFKFLFIIENRTFKIGSNTIKYNLIHLLPIINLHTQGTRRGFIKISFEIYINSE